MGGATGARSGLGSDTRESLLDGVTSENPMGLRSKKKKRFFFVIRNIKKPLFNTHDNIKRGFFLHLEYKKSSFLIHTIV